MRKILFLFFVAFSTSSIAQRSCYHLFCYTVPAGWEKEEMQSGISYIFRDAATHRWCKITVYSATGSKGDSMDFQSEWDQLVRKAYKVQDKSVVPVRAAKNGWKILKGKSAFSYSGQSATALLYTYTNKIHCASIVATTNDKTLFPVIDQFIKGVEINTDFKPATSNEKINPPVPVSPAGEGFAFTTTRFDDGWFAEVKPDHVEVTKGEIKILIHFADARTNKGGDPVPQINTAWDVLVAPKYKSLKNYKTASPSIDYDRAYFGGGDVTDAGGRNLYVALFRRRNTGWMEFICRNKQEFVNSFGVDVDKIDWGTTGEVWSRMENMAYYNRFAVGASDLKGTWTSDFNAMQEYYNIFTGSHMATSIHQSAEIYVFNPGQQYTWSLLTINGQVGAVRYDQAKNAGTFSLPNNWQIYYSNLEGKPKTYDAYFSCIRGGRLLWMQNAQYKNGWTCYGLKKP